MFHLFFATLFNLLLDQIRLGFHFISVSGLTITLSIYTIFLALLPIHSKTHPNLLFLASDPISSNTITNKQTNKKQHLLGLPMSFHVAKSYALLSVLILLDCSVTFHSLPFVLYYSFLDFHEMILPRLSWIFGHKFLISFVP